jgi:protein-S-isoprenylcysteine O-methyltransferase Ste14
MMLSWAFGLLDFLIFVLFVLFVSFVRFVVRADFRERQ